MTEPQQTGTPPVPDESPDGETPTVSELDRKVDSIIETLKRIVSPGEKPEAAEPAAGEPDVGAEVRAELAKLKAAEDRKKKAEDRDKEVSELKDTVAKIKERKPKEYRKVTNLVWGRDED